MESLLGRELPTTEPVGESWELCESESFHSEVHSEVRAGSKLGELWRSGVLGGTATGDFPFLLKWLDTDKRMSVQVHPDEEFCRNTRVGRPKTEAWFITHVEPGARLLAGSYPGLDPQILAQAVERGTIAKWMYEVNPRVGDMFLIRSGTMHSIGAGLIILEVQQPSDTTFRLYDWDNGGDRELHFEQAAACINYDRFDLPRPKRNRIFGPSFSIHLLRMGAATETDDLRVFVANSGPVRLVTDTGQHELAFGDVIVAERDDGEICIAQGSCLLVTEPKPEPPK